MPDAPHEDPTADAAATTATDSSADAALTPAEEQKRRFREALDRKQGVKHPDDTVGGGKSLHGRGGATNRQEFRRKSGSA